MPRKDTSKYVDTDSLVREGCFIGGCSVMHRNIGLLCDEDIPVASDWLYWIELSYKGELGYINEILSEYRRHEANITKNTKLDVIYKEQLLTLQKVKIENLKNSNSLFLGRVRVELMLCTLYLRNEDYKNSLNHLENVNFKKLGYLNKIFLLKVLLKFGLGKILKKYFMCRVKY